MATSPTVDLWLPFGAVCKLALSIPFAVCGNYAVNPLRWLRFIAYAIYGHEGYLSTSHGGIAIILQTLRHANTISYHRASEPRLVDIDATDDRTSDTSDLTGRRADFRRRVIARDETCVVTGYPVFFCDACHILPHSKGHNYILNVIHYRSRTNNPVNDFDGIDDSRNGLLLWNTLHRVLGAAESAFLKTPNFGLTVDDIPLRQVSEENPTNRFTLHHFDVSQLDLVFGHCAPNNSDARLPQDTSEWPPEIIIDYAYAVAVLRAWAPSSFINYAREQTRHNYYVPEVSTSGQTCNHNLRPRHKTQPVHLTAQVEDRYSDVMDAVLGLWMYSSKGDRPKPETHASHFARDEDVKTWLQSVEQSVDANKNL